MGDEMLMVDLIEFDISNFELMLRMDWLLMHRSKIDCGNWMVSLRSRHEVRCILKENMETMILRLFVSWKLRDYLGKGVQGSYATLRSNQKPSLIFKVFPFASEFPDVVPYNLQALHPNKKLIMKST